MTDTFPALAAELEGVFIRGVDEAMGDEEFQSLALRIFAHQWRACRPYRAFCEGRGATPETVLRWEDVPAVPATAFKHLDLLSAQGAPEAVFRTSGTTVGADRRGRHLVPSLALYRASLLPNFAAYLLPEGERMPLLSLIAPPSVAPQSSLSTMIGAVAGTLVSEVRWVETLDNGSDVAGFIAAARDLERSGRAALVVGTAFAFVHLLDALEATGERVHFPEGTRIMETGGFKGRSRVVARDALYRAIADRLGVPERRIVNEYGMTELLSQLYEPVLREGPDVPGRHVPPPWLRVRALDPMTLAPLSAGKRGVLAFFDLANLGSVSHVLTEDVGTVSADGVRLQGRAVGAEPRGCSLAVDEILLASGRPSGAR